MSAPTLGDIQTQSGGLHALLYMLYEASCYLDYASDNKPAVDALPLIRVSLESVVAAIYDAGATDLGRQLDERYLDFGPVYDLIDNWEPHAMV